MFFTYLRRELRRRRKAPLVVASGLALGIALVSENIGFVFQSFNLIPTLTAQENVETELVPLGAKAKERRERAAEALRSVGLGERLGHLPGGC